MTPDFALACWSRALTEEIGIILTLSNVADKREIERLLYQARKAAGDPALDEIRLARPGDNPLELWLIKKTTDMEDVR